MRRIIFIVGLLSCIMAAPALADEVPWYRTWESYPIVPTVTPSMAKNIMLKEKAVLVYGGYEEQKEILCGSEYIPVGLVPPGADGSKVEFNYPKDTWVLVYCP